MSTNDYDTKKAALVSAIDAAADSIGPALRDFEQVITDADELAATKDLHNRANTLLGEAKAQFGEDQFQTQEGGSK